MKLIVFQFAEADFVPRIVVLMVFAVLVISHRTEIVQNLLLNLSGILLHILLVVITA